MQYAEIRKHRKRLKVGRWIHNHLKGFVAAWQWIKKLWQPIASRLGWIKMLNPFRFIKILDRYIIRKFIGTYLFAIALIMLRCEPLCSIITRTSSLTSPICSVRCSSSLRSSSSLPSWRGTPRLSRCLLQV